MGAQRHGLGVLRVEALDDLGPQHAGGAHLGDLHEVVLADAPEEGEARGEGVDGEPRLDARAQVLQAVRQRVAQLDVRRAPRLLDVVARYADAVELRHVLRGVGEDVPDDAHRGLGRVDVRVADHELLQDVVLDRAGQDGLVHALLLRGQDVEGQDGQHGAVHRHGDGHLVQRDAGEQDFHVQDGVHGHPRLAHVAHDARVVGVVAAVRRQVEGDGEALLARGQVAPVEGVALLGRGEAGVLAHRPGARDVHRGVGPPQEGRQPRLVEGQMGKVPALRLRVEGWDVDLLHRSGRHRLGRRPRLRLEVAAPDRLVKVRAGSGAAQRNLRKIRVFIRYGHLYNIPFIF